MATSNLSANHSEQDTQHAVYYRHFNSNQRKWMLEEDLYSGRTVSLVLVSIVTMGLIGMILTVIATL